MRAPWSEEQASRERRRRWLLRTVRRFIHGIDLIELAQRTDEWSYAQLWRDARTLADWGEIDLAEPGSPNRWPPEAPRLRLYPTLDRVRAMRRRRLRGER